ncbi:uncharacterized protein LOC131049268 [Cryptomeria japonica]|uniref:uncharacterized protein LOC131049268 n=1 Tax=Cryptomeria japonica TaxID=3369 RepID=UPI0027DA1B16|nr:uncharacterized protein LOC131049268 [Cryptomeria japonica]XP_059063728.1 uncharacterized protein LOC131049268 [Cryptomeria japonica]XP_059063729.1 uncharacterized protein LOC131049268 [Cryptomeria japonica]
MSYDFMTAIQLFREGGISARLYTDFLELYLFLQKVFQGPMAELIFIPYFQEVERLGGSILQGMYVQDAVSHDNSDRITSFIADTRRKANADKDEAARQRQHQGYSNCTSHSGNDWFHSRHALFYFVLMHTCLCISFLHLMHVASLTALCVGRMLEYQ